MEKENQLDVSLEDLMSGYLDICNRAMQENIDKFWYQQAKRLNRILWDESNFHTIVYDLDPDITLDEFMIHFNPDERELSLISPEGQEVAFTWKVPLGYLKDVVENRPDWYIEHPVMLDWKWLTERTRTESMDLMRKPRLLKTGITGFLLGTAAGALSVYLTTRHTSQN